MHCRIGSPAPVFSTGNPALRCSRGKTEAANTGSCWQLRSVAAEHNLHTSMTLSKQISRVLRFVVDHCKRKGLDIIAHAVVMRVKIRPAVSQHLPSKG